MTVGLARVVIAGSGTKPQTPTLEYPKGRVGRIESIFSKKKVMTRRTP